MYNLIYGALIFNIVGFLVSIYEYFSFTYVEIFSKIIPFDTRTFTSIFTSLILIANLILLMSTIIFWKKFNSHIWQILPFLYVLIFKMLESSTIVNYYDTPWAPLYFGVIGLLISIISVYKWKNTWHNI